MKKFLIAATALTAAFAATAGVASADTYGRDFGRHERDYRDVALRDPGVNQRQREIAFRIDQGQRNGGISVREARYLREELRDIERLEARYRRDGFSRWEVSDLDRRLDALSRKVRFERRDFDRRGRW